MLIILSLLLVQNVLGVRVGTRIDPLVQTKLGLIRGMSANDGDYAKFLGIPYAVVDEEDLFAPSQPHGGFNETYNAFDDSVVCPHGSNTGDLQCLRLNVYVPNKATTQNPLPVMVFIHGGGFSGGSGGSTSQGYPNWIVQKDVIFISINYRLGLYGFLCTDSPRAPGNIGLKDQLLALRWIRDNIAEFGGNPNQVTAFGVSAGSMSIHMHLLSPHEKLFHAAILQSGPATAPLSMNAKDNSIPLQIAANLGYDTESLDNALDFIAKTDVRLALDATNKLEGKNAVYSSERQTKPCVEEEFPGLERFIASNPREAKIAESKLIPILIGHTSQESLIQHRNKDEDFFENYSFKDLTSFGFDVEDFDDMINALKRFYIGDEKPGAHLANEITNFASDFFIIAQVQKAIKNLLDNGATLYHYMFSYIRSDERVLGNTYNIAGAAHLSDMSFIFNQTNLNYSEDDILTSERLVTMWTNFAKYGVPIVETNDLLPVAWPPATKEIDLYLNIDTDLSIQSKPYHDRMAFFDLFYRLNADRAFTFENTRK